MASTRNKNTPSNYCWEQKQYAESRQYTTYKNSAYGEAYTTNWAGNGLNPGQLPWNTMSYNAPDIESFLFGINSTNLVAPRAPLKANLKSIPTVPFFDRLPVFMPHPLVVEAKQRPFPIG